MSSPITKPMLAALRAEMNAALASVAQKHGIAISVGNCSFTEATATFKVLVATGAANGENAEHLKARADFTTYALAFGLEASWLDREFQRGGSTYKVAGLYPNKRKNPVVVLKDGKRYLLPADDVSLRLRKPQPLGEILPAGAVA